MHENILRGKLKLLIGKVNQNNGNEKLYFAQQKIKTKNMSILGGNGRLRVQPTAAGFTISLCCTLISEMYSFMEGLFQRKHDGSKQPNDRQPFWKADDDDLDKLEKAMYRYAETKP